MALPPSRSIELISVFIFRIHRSTDSTRHTPFADCLSRTPSDFAVAICALLSGVDGPLDKQIELLLDRRLNQADDLVLKCPGPARLWQIPADEHAYQKGNKGTHICGVRKNLILINNRQKNYTPFADRSSEIRAPSSGRKIVQTNRLSS